MSTNKFTDEFKRDAVAQVEDRGYPKRIPHRDRTRDTIMALRGPRPPSTSKRNDEMVLRQT